MRHTGGSIGGTLRRAGARSATRFSVKSVKIGDFTLSRHKIAPKRPCGTVPRHKTAITPNMLCTTGLRVCLCVSTLTRAGGHPDLVVATLGI
jgi:hypothetical protein